MARDSQKTRVFTALTSMPEWYGPPMSYDDVQDLRAGLAERKVLRKKFPNFYRLSYPSGRSTGLVCIGQASFKQWTLLKVLFVWTRELGLGAARHDAVYCKALLEIVQNFMGRDVATRLKAEFKKNRVKYRKPREDITNPKGNPQALRMYRLGKEIEGQSKSLFDVFDAKEGKG